MCRVVRSEWLDDLPAANPDAVRARADLRRFNCLMGHARIIARVMEPHLEVEIARHRPLRISELGAGDGWLLLQLARIWATQGVSADAELVDLRYLLTGQMRHAFGELAWSVTPVARDVRVWLAAPEPQEPADMVLANFFLHHFEDAELREMFRQVAGRTACFIACEPRRSDFALKAARFVRAVGCGPVIRHDAPLSVRAGFDGREIAALWPDPDQWVIAEGAAGWFSHYFMAKKIPF
jgi:hypothetical protein